MGKICHIVKPFFSEIAPRDGPSCLPKTGKHACFATAENTAFLRAEAAAFKPARRLLLRQPDAERRAAGLTFNLNLSLMLFDDFPANIQPQAASFARRFRRKKWLENARLDLRRNAAAGIRDFNDDS